MDSIQIQRMQDLGRFLYTRPSSYGKHFRMRNFGQSPTRRGVPSTPYHVLGGSSFHPQCVMELGATACALGHAVYMGEMFSPIEGERWEDYADRLFGVKYGSTEWDWLFSTTWGWNEKYLFDDSHIGAGLRLLHYAMTKRVPVPFDMFEENQPVYDTWKRDWKMVVDKYYI